MQAAAGLSFGAALIHGSVIATHVREWWMFGLFFALVTPLQLAWAIAVLRGASRRVLLAGALGNLAIVVVWVISRTTGLPFGPEPGEAEEIGFKDILATVDELALAGLVLVVLWRERRRIEQLVAPVAWSLVAVSFVAAMIGGH